MFDPRRRLEGMDFRGLQRPQIWLGRYHRDFGSHRMETDTRMPTDQAATVQELIKQVNELRKAFEYHTCHNRHPNLLPGEPGPDDPFSIQIAHSITGIIGLKEALTWPQKILKTIWVILLIAGIAATAWLIQASAQEYLDDPTATKVKLIPQPQYDYPPLLLCPDAWLNVSSAESLGMSLDAMIYALGYFDRSDPLDLGNSTTAKEEFLRVYKSHNFSSLDHFLKAIAADIAVTTSLNKFVTSQSPSAWCAGCKDNGFLDKIFFERGICYIVNLAAEDGLDSRRALGGRLVGMVMEDLTRGIIQTTNLWRIFAINNTNLTIRHSNTPPLFLPTFALNYVTVSMKRYAMLARGDGSCIGQEEIQSGYSSETCYADCINKIYRQTFNCIWLPDEPNTVGHRNSTAAGIKPIEEKYCNYFDMDKSQFLDRFDAGIRQSQIIASLPDRMACVRKCPYECDKMEYTVVSQSRIDEPNLAKDLKAACWRARQRNMSTFALQAMHEGFFEGGILTLTEVNTLTLPGLISNLGGALGLFVGATIMTIFQIVLFMIRYVVEAMQRRSRVRAEASPPSRIVIYGQRTMTTW